MGRNKSHSFCRLWAIGPFIIRGGFLRPRRIQTEHFSKRCVFANEDLCLLAIEQFHTWTEFWIHTRTITETGN
jgi:hypothetical protein